MSFNGNGDNLDNNGRLNKEGGDKNLPESNIGRNWIEKTEDSHNIVSEELEEDDDLDKSIHDDVSRHTIKKNLKPAQKILVISANNTS